MDKGNTVLITGVAGFIGRYVARRYHQQGYTVIGVDLVPPENAPMACITHYVRSKIPDRAIFDMIKKTTPDTCIHCAGRASVGESVINPNDDFYSSPVVTFELLDALRTTSPSCRFVMISSAAVYGNPETMPVAETCPANPISPYGFHKAAAEQICQEFSTVYGIPTSIARIFTAYGPGLRRQVIWDICYKALVKKKLLLQGTGAETRDFIHAVDIAVALDMIAQAASTKTFVCNVASGSAVSIKKLAEMILGSLGVILQPEFDGKVPQGNPINWQADISKLESLGYAPLVQLPLGVDTFSKWCKAELLGI
jgi:UDP-glucose 4-epimerase